MPSFLYFITVYHKNFMLFFFLPVIFLASPIISHVKNSFLFSDFVGFLIDWLIENVI